MIIGFLLDDSLDRPDGVQQYILTLGTWLSQHGHTVHYLVGHTERTDIANVHSLAKVKRVKFNANLVGTPLPANKRKIKTLLDTLQLDVLHVQLPYSPVLAGRVVAAVSSSTAVVGTLHIFPNSPIEHGLNRLLTLINNPTLRRFDEIVAVSQVAADASHLPNRAKLAVIPNPVSLTRFKPTTKPKRLGTTICFLGRLVERKGCGLLLKVLAGMKKAGELPKDIHVRIGGDGHLRTKLETFTQANGLSDIISFEGFISEDDKPAFLQSADIAVYPSSGGESFGIVLIEAMAAGAVTLGGNNPGYAGVLTHKSPALFDTQTPDALRLLLKRLFEDTAFYNQLLKSQQALVKQYDIEEVGQKISELYTKTLRARRNKGIMIV